MFTISQIRALARQTVNTIPGMYTLALVPVGLGLLMNMLQYFGPNSFDISELAYNQDAASSSLLISSIFPIVYGLLTGLVLMSVTMTVFQIVRKTKEIAEIKDAIAIFSSPHFGKIFSTFLVKNIFLFLWGLLAYFGVILFIAAIVFAAIVAYASGVLDSASDDAYAVVGLLFILGLLFMVAGLAIYIPQQLAYSQVECILFEQLENNEYAGATKIIKQSRQMMKGYKGKRFVLDLSFIGWFFLQGITFGLVGIYVIPYYNAAQVHFYQALKTDIQTKQAAYFNQFNQSTASPAQEPAAPVEEKAAEKPMDSAIDSPIDEQK